MPPQWPEFSTELKKNDLNEHKLKELVDSKEERTNLVKELKWGKLLEALKDNKTTINTFCEKIFAWKSKEDATKKWSSEAAILYLYTALNATELGITLQSPTDPSLEEVSKAYDAFMNKKTPEIKDTKLEVKDIKDINLVEIKNIVLANGKNWSEAPTHQELVDAINAIQWEHKAKIIGFMKEIGTYATNKDKVNTEKTTIALQKYLIDDCKCTIYGWADGKIWRYTYNTIVNLSSTEKKDTEGKIVYKRNIPEKKAEFVKGENKNGAKVQNTTITTPSTTPTNNEGKIPFKAKEETAVTTPTTPVDVTKIVPQYSDNKQEVQVPLKIDEIKISQQTTTPTDTPKTFTDGSPIPNTKVWEAIKQQKSQKNTEGNTIKNTTNIADNSIQKKPIENNSINKLPSRTNMQIDTKNKPISIIDDKRNTTKIIDTPVEEVPVKNNDITPGNKVELTPNNNIYESRKEPKKEAPLQETPKEKPNDVVNKVNEVVDKSAEILQEANTNLHKFWEIKNFVDDNPKLVKTINDVTSNIINYLDELSADIESPIKKATYKNEARRWINELKSMNTNIIKDPKLDKFVNELKNYAPHLEEEDPPQLTTSLWDIVNNYLKVIHDNNKIFSTKNGIINRDSQGNAIAKEESDTTTIRIAWKNSGPQLRDLTYWEFFTSKRFEELRAIKNPEFEIRVNKLADRQAGLPQTITSIIVTEKK